MKETIIYIFKAIAFLVLFIFVYFISDVNKIDSRPLIKEPWLTLMRMLFPIPPIAYFYYLYKMDEVTWLDIIALMIMISGVIIIGFSKKKLGKRHSWAGYYKQNIDSFVKSGIYKYIRHPLYTGIYVAVTGSMIVVFQRMDIKKLIFWAYLLVNIAVYVFIFLSSQKETIALKERFGEEFTQYEREVPAFIPRLFPSKEEDYDIKAE